jgi:hypothetical protein
MRGSRRRAGRPRAHADIIAEAMELVRTGRARSHRAAALAVTTPREDRRGMVHFSDGRPPISGAALRRKLMRALAAARPTRPRTPVAAERWQKAEEMLRWLDASIDRLARRAIGLTTISPGMKARLADPWVQELIAPVAEALDPARGDRA